MVFVFLFLTYIICKYFLPVFRLSFLVAFVLFLEFFFFLNFLVALGLCCWEDFL